MRISPDLVERYAANKREWAEVTGWEKLKYSQSKDDFINEVLNR
ncbi:MAG: GrpB family protein [Desulfobacteraceae bacterium]|nr:GrpB family protein [Desulfobacteraceae bacterium]